MTSQTVPPVLSTPEQHIFEDPTPPPSSQPSRKLSDDEISEVYEVQRTARELREGGYKRVALQFPDAMLGDGVRVSEELERELKRLGPLEKKPVEAATNERLETDFNTQAISIPVTMSAEAKETHGYRKTVVAAVPGQERSTYSERTRLYILADTSYGSCCVDEIAAEHVDADVVVHYGRSCLSPTARLPVIYVYTSHPLIVDGVVEGFESTFGGEGKDGKVVLMADITYHSHIPAIKAALEGRGYGNIIAPEIIHDPSSAIPNRKIPEGLELKEYTLFHISDPPPALLLTLSSRVKDMFIYPTNISSTGHDTSTASTSNQKAIQANTAMTLRRRYALITRLSTCAIFGILINTLSVRNYLETVTSIKTMIEQAGKKSYTFVVGKVNAAKIANFSEIGGWVVIGCWESSLIESTEFYRPIITPFELEMCLQGDEKRVWTGEWRGDFSSLALNGDRGEGATTAMADKDRLPNSLSGEREEEAKTAEADEDSEEESAPPEFDFRTGRYVSHSRPMRNTHTPPSSNQAEIKAGDPSAASSQFLTRRAKGHLATVNGAVSPGAEYLRSQRTWAGLGSDFNEDASTTIEEGRSGVARGYTVGEEGGEERR